MAHMAVQLLGYILSIIGLCGLILSTFTNEWKVTGYDNDKIQFNDVREGLWMKCSFDSSLTGLKCSSYTSILYQSGRLLLITYQVMCYLSSQSDVIIKVCAVVVEIKVVRVMMIISIGLAGLGVLVAVAGLQCTTCLDGDDQLKDKVTLTGGCCFILSGEFHILNIIQYDKYI